MAKDVIVVITTGGTIAMRDEGEGAVPAVGGADLLGAAPPDLSQVEIQVEEFSNLPSTHLTLAQMWNLQKTVSDRLDRLYVRGVVVTHGTDTLEESAYLLDYSVPVDKAIVLTGAMRTGSDLGYDGLQNLWSAIRVALDPAARGRGTMVVLNDEIHAARYVTKLTSHNPAAFGSPGWGPMGRLYGDRIVWGWQLERDYLPVRNINPDVHLLTLAAGANEGLLKVLIERRVSGIVIEAFGGGRVPPWWMQPIRDAVQAGIAVVIATRPVAGYTRDAYGYPGGYRDLEESGVIFAEGLTGPKARIRLMCALGAVQG
jgi:L-asparaginase